jgi:hypothetical protein
MDNSVRQHPEVPQKPLTRYAQQKERLLQNLLDRTAKAEKIRKSEKRKIRSSMKAHCDTIRELHTQQLIPWLYPSV